MSLNMPQAHSNDDGVELQPRNEVNLQRIQTQLEELQRMQAALLRQRADMQSGEQPSQSYLSKVLNYRIKVSHLVYLLSAAYLLKKAYDLYTYQEIEIAEPEELSWAQWAFNGSYAYVTGIVSGVYAAYNKRWNIGLLNKIEDLSTRFKNSFLNSRAGILLITTASRAPLVGRIVTQQQEAPELELEFDAQIKKALLDGLADLDILNHPERMRFNDGKIIINDPFIMREITRILDQENPHQGGSTQQSLSSGQPRPNI